MKCRVSVAMTSYNGEKYIHKQLSSVLSNLGTNDEVVISDDGSTDNTISIVEKFDDPRIKLIMALLSMLPVMQLPYIQIFLYILL